MERECASIQFPLNTVCRSIFLVHNGALQWQGVACNLRAHCEVVYGVQMFLYKAADLGMRLSAAFGSATGTFIQLQCAADIAADIVLQILILLEPHDLYVSITN